MQRPTQGHRDCASLRQFLARGGDHLVVLVEAAVREDAVHDDATHPLQLRVGVGFSLRVGSVGLGGPRRPLVTLSPHFNQRTQPAPSDKNAVTTTTNLSYAGPGFWQDADLLHTCQVLSTF